MSGLRGKLLAGLGGLLAILVAVTLLSNSVLSRYSDSIQQLFQNDYDSAADCQAMKEAVERMLLRARVAPAAPSSHVVDPDIVAFEHELELQSKIADIPGEEAATARLRSAWETFRDHYRAPNRSIDELTSRADAVRAAAQSIIDMNLAHMEGGREQARDMASRATFAMHFLAVAGIGVAGVVVALAGSIILRPVQTLEKSVRQIAAGNLNLSVPVRSDDEIGRLGRAFNDMAAQLREFKRADQAKLVRTQHTTQLAIDSLPDAVVLIEPRGEIELANETAQRLFALRPGMSVFDLSEPWLSDLHQEALTDPSPHRPAGYSAAITIDDAGERRSFLPRTFAILDERQEVIGSAVILADVTELRHMDDMKNNLLATSAHELKTPLTSMRMAMHLVTEQRIGPLNERQHELLLAAREDSDRLHHIVETLLDMDRLRAGEALVEPRAVTAGDVVNAAADAARAEIESHGITLKIDLRAAETLVGADRDRLAHVFDNLIANSIRFTPRGGTITLAASPESTGVRFTVADTGSGIAEPLRRRVFERFFRAPGQSGESGTGLGLAIVKEIIEAHRGRVWLDSRPGAGTSVHFVLPAFTTTSKEPSHDDTTATQST